MINEKLNSMLWVDDDGWDRYIFEKMMLEQKGWNVDWAFDVKGAAKKLAKEPYLAILLDQMLPFIKTDAPELKAENCDNPWGGCAVLRWLRKAELPSGIGVNEQYKQLSNSDPLPENINSSVLVVSAYYDDDIRESMRQASPQDSEIQFEPKPIVIDALIDFLDKAKSEAMNNK